jgi:hypothetical protein
MSAQTTTIPNTGADRLRTAVLRRAAVFAAAVAASLVAAVTLAGEPIYVREGIVAPLALVAALAAGYLLRAIFEFLETPTRIEYSPIVFFVRYQNKPFLGLSWCEINSIMPVKTRYKLLGEPLYDLKLSIIHGKDRVIGNLSLSAGRMFITAFHQNAKKLSPDEAAKVSDKWFHIKTF